MTLPCPLTFPRAVPTRHPPAAATRAVRRKPGPGRVPGSYPASTLNFKPTIPLSAYNALRYARENEVRAMEYYAQVGQQTGDGEVRRLAVEFAAEETEHVEAIEDWLARTPRPSATMADDPDRS